MKKRYTILLIGSYTRNCYERLHDSLKESEIILISDPRKARDFFSCNDIDLIFINYDSDDSCVKMLQFLKSRRPLIPVVITTCNSSEEFAVKVFKCGADDYFKIPFAIVDEFETRIKDILGINHKKDKDGIDIAVGSIHKHYPSKIALPQIARKAGMSISLFNREFKKRTGTTFTKYINNVRINKAISLLKGNSFTMNEIAFTCGFTNQYHFTRTFKKITKKSPRDFKRSMGRPQ